MDKNEFFKKIAEETAKMSYPGAMSFQPKGEQIVTKGTKNALSLFFQNDFPIAELWNNGIIPDKFDAWHHKIVTNLSEEVIAKFVGGKRYYSYPISAKFLNTFMHQLMKYGRFRYLYEKLHLPLDSRVFDKLKNEKIINGTVKVPENLRDIAQKNAYSITSKEYKRVQLELLKLIENVNKVSNGIKIKARIELNSVLWL